MQHASSLLCKIFLCFQQIVSAHNWQLPSKEQILNIFFAKNSPYHCTGEAGGEISLVIFCCRCCGSCHIGCTFINSSHLTNTLLLLISWFKYVHSGYEKTLMCDWHVFLFACYIRRKLVKHCNL